MKLKDFVTKWAWQILAGLFFLLYLGKGCTSSKMSKTNNLLEEKTLTLEHKVDSLTEVIGKMNQTKPSSSEVRDIMEVVMLDYLIYEDDLDKGKTSLSQIKDKIKSND